MLLKTLEPHEPAAAAAATVDLMATAQQCAVQRVVPRNDDGPLQALSPQGQQQRSAVQ